MSRTVRYSSAAWAVVVSWAALSWLTPAVSAGPGTVHAGAAAVAPGFVVSESGAILVTGITESDGVTTPTISGTVRDAGT